MPEKIPPKKGIYQDEWGTGTREGYEDRPRHVPRKPIPKPRGNRFLRIAGGLLIVGGIFWAAYLYPSSPDIVATLRQNHGPAFICGGGLFLSLLGKYIRL